MAKTNIGIAIFPNKTFIHNKTKNILANARCDTNKWHTNLPTHMLKKWTQTSLSSCFSTTWSWK